MDTFIVEEWMTALSTREMVADVLSQDSTYELGIGESGIQIKHNFELSDI